MAQCSTGRNSGHSPEAAARAARIAAAAAALALAVAVAECGPDLRAALPERQPVAQQQRAVLQ